MGISLTPDEQLELFGPDSPAKHEAEARERWGNTEAWRESRRRSAAYTTQDWIEIKAQADANLAAFARAMASGEHATGERAFGATRAPAGDALHRALGERALRAIRRGVRDGTHRLIGLPDVDAAGHRVAPDRRSHDDRALAPGSRRRRPATNMQATCLL